MPFIHPIVFITGMAAASIPIIIHILNRRRFKIRDWAAMKFLLDSVRKNRRRVRIEEIILLVLRTLVLVLLAMAIGRFTGCGDSDMGLHNKGASTTVFILDDSASMGQKVGSGNIFAAATGKLIEQIRKLPESEQVGIILTSRVEPFQDRGFLDKNLIEPIVGRLQALKVSDTCAKFGEPQEKAGALAAAFSMLENDTSPNKSVVILGDFRKVDLQKDQAEQIRKQFAALKEKGINVTVLDFGRECGNNLSVEKIELVDKFAVDRAPIRIRLTVRNNGSQSIENVATDIKIKYLAKGEFSEVAAPQQTIKLIPAHDTAYLNFTINSPAPGPMVVTASLPPDELIGDNSASLALDVRPALRVLVVDGNYDVANPLANESFFFIFAIDPKGDGSYGNKPDVITPEDIEKVSLDDYDLVVMMNVGQFPASGRLDAPVAAEPASQPGDENKNELYPGLARLERYVRGGGGLAVFTGDKVNLDFYGPTDNEKGRGRFYNGGKGLLPVPLGPSVPAKEEYFRFDQSSFKADALLQTFNDFNAKRIDIAGLIRVSEFSSADESAMKDSSVLARFNDEKKSPAIITGQFGKGTVVLFLTTGSKNWTDWPINESGTYIATVNDMLMYIARPAKAELTGLVGDQILYELPIVYRDARATLKVPPTMDEITVEQSKDVRGQIKFTDTRNAGTYWLGLDIPKDRRDVLLARNVSGNEGQLTPGRQADITNAFGGNEKDYTYIDQTDPAKAGILGAGSQKEYWMIAIAAMLVLMAAETFLGQRFGHYNG